MRVMASTTPVAAPRPLSWGSFSWSCFSYGGSQFIGWKHGLISFYLGSFLFEFLLPSELLLVHFGRDL
jgi:hypothetical protein